MSRKQISSLKLLLRKRGILFLSATSTTGKTTYIESRTTHEFVDGDQLVSWPKVPFFWKDPKIVESMLIIQHAELMSWLKTKDTDSEMRKKQIIFWNGGSLNSASALTISLTKKSWERNVKARMERNKTATNPQGSHSSYLEYIEDHPSKVPHVIVENIEELDLNLFLKTYKIRGPLQLNNFDMKIKVIVMPPGCGKSTLAHKQIYDYVDFDDIAYKGKLTDSPFVDGYKTESLVQLSANWALICHRTLLVPHFLPSSFDFRVKYDHVRLPHKLMKISFEKRKWTFELKDDILKRIHIEAERRKVRIVSY